MKRFIKDHWRTVVVLAILIGTGIAASFLTFKKADPAPSVNERAAALIKSFFDGYENYYLCSELEELAVKYKGTPIEKDLDDLYKQADDLEYWLKTVAERAEKLNFALPEEYNLW